MKQVGKETVPVANGQVDVNGTKVGVQEFMKDLAPADEIMIDKENFPDDIFRAFVKKSIADGQDSISIHKAKRKRRLKIQYLSSKEGVSLEGLELFPNLETIHIADSIIPKIDISSLKKLTDFECTNCEVKEIIFGDEKDCASNLQYIDLWKISEKTELKGVDLRGLKKLISLRIYKSKIKSLDLSKNKELKLLSLLDSSVEHIDFAEDNEIEELQLTYFSEKLKLDLSQFQKITTLSLQGTDIPVIDVSHNKELYELHITACNAKKLLLPEFSAIQMLDGGGNQIEEIDFKRLPDLKALNIPGYRGKNIDFSCCRTISNISISNSELESIDVSRCKSLEILACDGNKLKELNLQKLPCLSSVDCSGNEITKLNIKGCDKLKKESLFFSGNPLREVVCSDEFFNSCLP